MTPAAPGSPVKEREEAMRMLLAEVAPGLEFRVHKDLGIDWPATFKNPADDPRRKAVRLLYLRKCGPSHLAVCNAHRNRLQCDLIPVSWALLGHTCGRAS